MSAPLGAFRGPDRFPPDGPAIVDLDAGRPTPATGRAIGWMLSLDCGGCNPDAIRDPGILNAYVAKLVDRIGMTPWGEPDATTAHGEPPRARHFGDEYAGLAGYSVLQQLITTSNVTARIVNAVDFAGHAFESQDGLCIDVFSCREFDPADVIDLTVAVFGATKVTPTWHVRRIPT